MQNHKQPVPKKIIHIDMDGVIADFEKAIKAHHLSGTPPYDNHPDLIDGIFRDLEPIAGAIDAVNRLIDDPQFEVYILTTAPWNNPGACMHKRLWIQEKFGDKLRKRMTITHNKHLLKGDYLIDDRKRNGADRFEGELIHFGWNYEEQRANPFRTWDDVIQYLYKE